MTGTTINYNFRCANATIYNGSFNETDRENKRLKEENKLLKEQLSSRHMTYDTASINSTTDDNMTHRVNGPLSHVYSIPSQPITNRFQTSTNDLNDVSQNYDGPNIPYDTDQTEPKRCHLIPSRTANREKSYDEIDSVYRRDYPPPNPIIPTPLHYLHPVHYQSTSVPPPLPERRQPVPVRTINEMYTNRGRGESNSEESGQQNTARQIYPYQTFSFPSQDINTLNAARPQNRDNDSDIYRDSSFPNRDSNTPHALRPQIYIHEDFRCLTHEHGTPNAATQTYAHRDFGFPNQENGTQNAARPQYCDNQSPISCKLYTKVVDASYIKKSKTNHLNRDYYFDNGEKRKVRSKKRTSKTFVL